MTNEITKTNMIPFRYRHNEDLINKLNEMEPKVPSLFFNPNIINIFTDASKPDSFSGGVISHCITQTINGITATVLADSKRVNCNSTQEAELIALIYALINYNNMNLYNVSCVNIFTDSLTNVKNVRPYFIAMNNINSEQDMNTYLNSIDEELSLSDYLWLMCAERIRIKAPVNLYYIKAHTNDVAFIRTKFESVNGESITMNDSIKLGNYNCLVNSEVNKSLRVI